MAESPDTLRLAEEERAKQGIHELEFSFSGERDLHTHFERCQKNPGHPKFIPVKKLNKFHLPNNLATDKIKAWIGCLSQFTVKLSVNYVSPNRPDGYLLWNRRGQRVLSVGSGYVTGYPSEGDIDKMPCPFTHSADLSGNHEVYGYITVTTAKHVVFDDEEANHTTVEFFYDDPDDKKGVVTARGVKVIHCSIEGDFCELLCVTHDKYLIKQLTYNSLTAAIIPNASFWRTMIPSPRCTSHHTAKLSMNYVSPNRPPGYPLSDRAGQRVVSVGSGRVTDMSLGGNIDKLMCLFTNCAKFPRYELHGYITIVTPRHVVFDGEEAKHTTVEFLYEDPDDKRHIVKARGVKVRTSSIEGDVCELLCVTHDTVLIRQLIYKLLTAKSSLQEYFWNKSISWPLCPSHHIAKLSVNYVSRNRRPGYPLSDRAGQRVVSVGSGRVIAISLEGNKGKLPCPCALCAYLPRYEMWGYFVIVIVFDDKEATIVTAEYIVSDDEEASIVTTEHIVFGDEEAKYTTVEFFYNDRGRLVTARGVIVRTSTIEGDVCQLLCVTHDTFLIRQLPYNLLTVKKMETTDYLLNNILISPRCTPYPTAKLSVNYVSLKRPPGYPLSVRAGQSVVSAGSGRVIGVSLDENNKLPCLFTNCADLPGYHDASVYITVVTTSHVVFNDKEAKSTTVEFFYDDPDGSRHIVTARGVKVRTSSIEKGFCELVCVTHDELFGKMKVNYLQRLTAQKNRFCDLFRTVLPGLESVQCEKETGLKFIVKIRLNNPLEAVETLIVLMSFTEEIITLVLKHWDVSKNILHDMLESARCQRQFMLTLISFELNTAKSIDDEDKTTPFLHLNETLTNLLDTLTNSNIDSPPMCQKMFSSLVIELAKYYSTTQMMQERLYACSSFNTVVYSRNVQKVVDISNEIATVEVTFNRDAHFTTLHHQRIIMDYLKFIEDYKKCKPDDKECKPGDRECTPENLSVVGMDEILVERIEMSSDYACKLCNRKYKHETMSSEDSKCNKDDTIIIHIGHPHGQSKHVTIGRQIDCLTGDGFYHQLYTAPTCPGCSGGPVWMIPASGDLSDVYGVPHHGHYGNELNSGCSWTMYPQ